MFVIIYPYRNREVSCVEFSLKSLQAQTNKNFKVIFIDYGSEDSYAHAAEEVVNKFDFATYLYIGHAGLLWNKSKALNYGIKKAQSAFIITADVDVLFSNNFIETASKLVELNSYSLFKIGYLSKQVTLQQQKQLNLNTIETTHIGDTFGIGLFSKSTLESVGGLDEFFHFYGSEDEDLNYRIQLSGAIANSCGELLLYHQWHERYPQKRDNQLTPVPRLKNIMRINQRQFLWHTAQKIVHPNSKNWGHVYSKAEAQILENPQSIIQLENISAHIEHFFGDAISNYRGSVVQVIITEAAYYKTLKYQVKKIMGKQTQPYMTMKAVNDLILKAIVFHYRDHNYAYDISEDLKQICFTIDLKTTKNEEL
ncbi:glycosyltransferase [Bizionia argentinensis JUB59]|uniref:Glycosyltransferase n=1 Tax=Bizionia argentinensis JUB59 TaxID=1046627 RepID=G2EAS9_9FLAO|nr:glycosyltransferase [Bizionia argentinensis]EGV44460.1 glycosyltransferase [Bizionia argentinensis JUB59]